MKKLLTISFIFFATLAANAQGINFETGSWKDVLAKANKEKKPIYMDIYTTWCGPCKMMAAKIFPEKEAGDKYNKHFINYKIDAEKGEGLEIAKKYKVSGYPTNLYIDPKNEEVIYRVMGATRTVIDFNKRADIAIAEAKDPMKWDEYQTQFAKGKNDKKFLESYLEKATRLSKNADAALDVYVKEHAAGTPDDKTLDFLFKNTKTLDNNSVAVLEANKERISKKYPEEPKTFDYWQQSLPYATLEKAIEQKDEKLLTKIEAQIRKSEPVNSESQVFWFRKEFYIKTGNETKAWQTAVEESESIVKTPDSEFKKRDEKATEGAKESLMQQMKAMNVPADQYENTMKATFEKYPHYLKSASASAAQTLNATAWEVYENRQADKELVKQALNWSEKSLKLVEGMNDLWPSYADTYAHLLFISGDKAKAIAIQEEALKKAQAAGNTDNENALKASLEKMKSGKL